MDSISENLFPDHYNSAPTVHIERNEQFVCDVLTELGEINENNKYCRITDLTQFEDFTLNHYKPLDDAGLEEMSKKLGIPLTYEMTLAEAAVQLSQKKP